MRISGHGLAEDGRKLSKRLGNYIPSQELVEKYGADAIRYWATGARLGQNLRFSQKEVEMGHKTAVKLFNVARFLAMHIESAKDDGNLALEYADAWILRELNATIKHATRAFDEYSYSQARDSIDGFFWSKFTDYYVEFIKYRLFGNDPKSKAAAASTLKTVVLAILKLYAPIMPFITEQIYHDMYLNDEKDESIHLSAWPEPTARTDGPNLDDFSDVITAIDEIRKHKSQNGIPMGAELEDYKLETKLNIERHAQLVRGVMRVNNLT